MNTSCCTNPIRINTLLIKNRIVFPAMCTKYAAPDGGVTERMLRYYEERAKGGAGLVTIEATSVDPTGNSFSRGLSIADDARLPGLTDLARRVKRHGARISIQLQHGGRAALPQFSGHAVPLVSAIPGVTPYDNSVILSEEEIARLVECWGKAAIRAREAGFDAVEIHGAHGYLISQFLSPYTNRRTDGYGGSLENRMRFALEVCRKVRESVGPDFPVTYRMSAVEEASRRHHAGGFRRSRQAAGSRRHRRCIVSVGLRETNFMVSPPACVEKGWNAPLSRAVRDGIEAAVPVIVAGRVADEQTAQAIIDRGDADMVAMGRALIADPFLPAKVAAGEAGDIIRCVGCNEGCVAGSARGTGIGCALNPLSGAEGKYNLDPVASPKKVAVIGGGPAGMQAALAARFRGHTVDLYEKSDRLGGLLNVACKPPYKEDLGHVTGWFERQLKRAGVGLHLGGTLTPEAVRDLGADAVIVATGSAPVFPGFCRKARNAVVAQSILSGEAKAGGKALVIGGGLIGCETAEFLAAQGSDVTILELQPELAKDMESRTRRYLMQRLRSTARASLPVRRCLKSPKKAR
ncbi:MAG: FAD-dependent oxidoreductase [Bilophila wadsworthia]